MARKPGSKKLILKFFLQNIGKVLESRQIQAASGGASEWARRVCELRNEDGYQILTHKDRVDLKPNQYLMETAKRGFDGKGVKQTASSILKQFRITIKA